MILGIVIACFISQGRSTTLSFWDDTLTEVTKDGQSFIGINESKTVIAAWGVWDSATSLFSPIPINYPGYMYYETYLYPAKEISAGYTQTSPGSRFNILTGTLMSLGVYDLPFDTAYPWSNQVAMAVLTDPNWLAPIWRVTGETNYSFTTNTQAVFGTFSYNGGNEKIGLTTPAIPEPSSLSLLALGAVAVALRRKR